MSLSLTDFNYELPKELIAQQPASARDKSRLLVFSKSEGRVLEHARFFELPKILAHLSPTPLMIVRNNSSVIPARLWGWKLNDDRSLGKKVEILLAKQMADRRAVEWECLTKPGLKEGERVVFGERDEENNFVAKCIKNMGYTRLISFEQNGQKSQISDFYAWLRKKGHTPLPPYISSDKNEDELRVLYQTVYADKSNSGSVAAPTAGLHFTQNLLQELGKNYPIVDATLHVGLGTFLGVSENEIARHEMHTESFYLSDEAAAKINDHKARGGEILAIGTTTTRVLESCWDVEREKVVGRAGETDIFIYPPRRFNVVNHLLTNFHLPKSTLLMLIAAVSSAPNTEHDFATFGRSAIGKAYAEAIAEKYRFFSFGDAMLIW